MSKRKGMTCHCSSYKFPHRLGSGKCGQVRLLLDVMQTHTGYIEDGDEAVEWMSGYDTVSEAATAWLESMNRRESGAAALEAFQKAKS